MFDRRVSAVTDVQPVPDKDPDDWTTGNEPMTGPQASYLGTLAQEAGEDLPGGELTKAEASRLIEDLQARTGRGVDHGTNGSDRGGDAAQWR
jgi:hypothetical protein